VESALAAITARTASELICIEQLHDNILEVPILPSP